MFGDNLSNKIASSKLPTQYFHYISHHILLFTYI